MGSQPARFQVLLDGSEVLSGSLINLDLFPHFAKQTVEMLVPTFLELSALTLGFPVISITVHVVERMNCATVVGQGIHHLP